MPPRDALSGLWVPVITPFQDENIDFDALRQVVLHLMERGVHGLLALGTTGEAPNLSDEEAVEVVGTIVSTVNGCIPVLAGCGRAALKPSQELGQRFVARGVDGLLILTPFYYRGQSREEDLVDFFHRLGDTFSVPVLVYHIPQITEVWLQPETLCRMLEHPNVVGFKDSASKGGPLAEVLQQRQAKAFVGGGSRVLEAWEAGCRGAILAIAHIAPELCLALFEACENSEWPRARQLQALAAELTVAMRRNQVGVIKSVLRQRGLPAGQTRSPLPGADPEMLAKVSRILARIQDIT